MKRFLQILIVFCPFWGVLAQSIIIKGKVTDSKSKEPLTGVSIQISKLKGTTTNEKGEFTLETQGKLGDMKISYVGYQNKEINLREIDSNKPLLIELAENRNDLNEVVVRGITQEQAEAKEIKLNVNPVTVITSKQIESRAGTLNEVLARQAGVQLRQSGGLGSDTRISVRGLEGKRVAIFLNGNPLNTPDGSLGINDFPVQLIERIEIYKGSVPAFLGGDGLGSAVNVILKHRDVSYIDANFARQSYNTNIASLILKKSFDKQGIEIGAGIFDTRSDNDYIMQSPYQPELKIKRDHDKYHSVLAGGSIRFHKLWSIAELANT